MLSSRRSRGFLFAALSAIVVVSQGYAQESESGAYGDLETSLSGKDYECSGGDNKWSDWRACSEAWGKKCFTSRSCLDYSCDPPAKTHVPDQYKDCPEKECKKKKKCCCKKGKKDDHNKCEKSRPNVPEPPKDCQGKKGDFTFEWGKGHFCEPKDKHCKKGDKGKTYQDCLAIDKNGCQFITARNREIECTVKECRDEPPKEHEKCPQPPNTNKCDGYQDDFYFEWGAAHACALKKDQTKCEQGKEGVTYRDCLAVNKKTGKKCITNLNEKVKCTLDCAKNPSKCTCEEDWWN